MTTSELKAQVEATGSHFFERSSMKFFGDTMRNYGIRSATVETYNGEKVEVWELYRRKAVKCGLKTSAYFDKQTFEGVHPKRKEPTK